MAGAGMNEESDVYTEVQWLDSGQIIDLGWAKSAAYTAKATMESMNVTSVGIVMHEDPDILLLAQSHDPDNGNWLGVMAIAKDSIFSRKTLWVRGQIITSAAMDFPKESPLALRADYDADLP